MSACSSLPPELDEHLVASVCLAVARERLSDAMATCDLAERVVCRAIDHAQRALEDLNTATDLVEAAARHYAATKDPA